MTRTTPPRPVEVEEVFPEPVIEGMRLVPAGVQVVESAGDQPIGGARYSSA
ncbi:hypothetical protein [Kitasatospora sp. NPDC097691]|uniref:hypothetical protein n=1 Tax=Kitasatospora sp. NPDC097691 TaxID=3157231 RepID=UPI003318CA29